MGSVRLSLCAVCADCTGAGVRIHVCTMSRTVPTLPTQLSCGGERQERVLAAAAARREADGRAGGGGAMLLSIAGSSHNTFAGGAAAAAAAAARVVCVCVRVCVCVLPGLQTVGWACKPASRAAAVSTPHRHLTLPCALLRALRCADALPLFGQQTGWLLERLGLTARLDPVLGIHLCTTAVLNFLG